MRRPAPDLERLFRAACGKCGRTGHFTGAFVDGDRGRRHGLFQCDACGETYSTGKRGLEAACAEPAAVADRARARLQADPAEAIAWARIAAVLARRAGDPPALAAALLARAEAELLLSEHASARPRLDEAVAILCRQDDRAALGRALHLRALAAVDDGLTPATEALLREAAALLDGTEERAAHAGAVLQLSGLLEGTGRGEEALEACREAAALYDRTDELGGRIAARRRHARLLARRGDAAAAVARLGEALALIVSVRGSRWARRVEAETREALGDAEAARGELAAARRAWARARRLWAGLDAGPRALRRLDAKLGIAANDDDWPRLIRTSSRPGDPPDPSLPAVQRLADVTPPDEAYRGSGLPLGRHPGALGRPLPAACLGCGSQETLCTALTLSLTPHVERSWAYSLYCPACGTWSDYACWE